MKSYSAYNNDPTFKAAFVALLEVHREQDRLEQGTYSSTEGTEAGPHWRGCAVGCGIRSLLLLQNKLGPDDSGPACEDDEAIFERGAHLFSLEVPAVPRHLHAQLAHALNIPEELAHLEDAIFEGLRGARIASWPTEFAEAIHPGADLSLVWPSFVLWAIIKVEEEKPCVAGDLIRREYTRPFTGKGLCRNSLRQEVEEVGCDVPFAYDAFLLEPRGPTYCAVVQICGAEASANKLLEIIREQGAAQ